MRTEEHKDGKEEESDISERSSLYQSFLNERQEILRHKWFLSEKVGKDVGFEQALLDWVRHHRAKWKRSRK